MPPSRFLESNTARNHAKGKGYDSLAWRATQGKAPILDKPVGSNEERSTQPPWYRPLVDSPSHLPVSRRPCWSTPSSSCVALSDVHSAIDVPRWTHAEWQVAL